MRITSTVLENNITLLNEELGLNTEPYTTFTPECPRSHVTTTGNKGTLKLDCAYGGYKLFEMCGNGTGEREITYTRLTGKELQLVLDGITYGMKLQRENKVMF